MAINPGVVKTISDLSKEGLTLQQIGDAVNLSKQRVHQICKQHKIVSAKSVRQEKKELEVFKKWGHREDTDRYRTLRSKFSRKKTNAKRAGIEWDLDFGDVVWPEVCPALGVEMDYFSETQTESSPSFDRVDPNKGYVRGNVVIICWRANRIKNNGTPSELRALADYYDSIGRL
jgi:predicted DNA-binding protein YlxM (UPF0122 family)